MRCRLCLILALFALLFLAPPGHAATTCSSLRKYCLGTAASGNWTQFILPAGAAYVTVEVDGAAYVDGPEGGYTDGAARSSGGRSTSSGETVGFPLRVAGSPASIWVAGSGGSRAVTLYISGSEAQ